MNTITIILLIYVIIDIVAGIAIYAHLRRKGWRGTELARRFRDLLREDRYDFLKGIHDEQILQWLRLKD